VWHSRRLTAEMSPECSGSSRLEGPAATHTGRRNQPRLRCRQIPGVIRAAQIAGAETGSAPRVLPVYKDDLAPVVTRVMLIEVCSLEAQTPDPRSHAVAVSQDAASELKCTV
jgi:hypothetical protein